ncbi:MAG: PTS lactose/cellobiose transporter subunit IIA [Eubacteriaceae bacterium]|jgi:PTS system cellobiose-specific IIA component|nr:PTS lactose/cellobiose transporter subunit IIA [Eubacteriaceae bacterium]
MEGMEAVCFEIISTVGAAKSAYIGAIEKAKTGDYEEAAALIDQGNEMYQEGHTAHVDMLQKDAAGEQKAEFSLLLMHAEDQMMMAETFRIVAEDFIDVYKRLTSCAN